MSTSSRHLEPYDLVQQQASEASSEIWKAFDTRQRCYVTLSLLPFNTQTNPAFFSRFLQESATLQSLQHPSIVGLLNVQTLQFQNAAENRILLATEYVEGPTLAELQQTYFQQGKSLSPAQIIHLLAPVAAAIDYAHQHGVIHGAIRPSHIIFDKTQPGNDLPGLPRLTGFGMHYLYPPFTLPLKDVYYISPELAQGHTENARSDLYSLGVILYELCTGALPFQGDTPADIMTQHIQGSPVSPALINPHIPPPLTAVILRSIARDPVARFPTATALVTTAAQALNMPTQQIITQSGSQIGTTVNPSAPQVANMASSPTFLSPLPQSTGAAPTVASRPSFLPVVAQQNSGAIPVTTYPPQSAQSQPVHSFAPAQTPAVSIPYAPPQQDSARSVQKGRKPSRLYVALAIIGVILLLGSALGAFLLLRNSTTATTKPVVGHAFFGSSGQLNLNSEQGIADQIQVDVDKFPAPQAGKNYYFWLLSDSDNAASQPPILLGSSPNGGHIRITYDKNTQHDNLLIRYSRFLVTEEATEPQPVGPSPDTRLWRYYAAFSQQKVANDPYSLLDHLRHLLAKDPKLQALPKPLNGGLDIWLFRNTLKILEAAGSARDAQTYGDTGLIQRQLVRILDYLEGAQYVQREALPAGIQPVLIDPQIAQVALLQIDEQQQNPPGYLKHIGGHLNEISQLPNASPSQKKLAIKINTALNNVQDWMRRILATAAQLLKKSGPELLQADARMKLNDLFTLANYAFTGQIDPNTNQVREGVSQIHYNILQLATFDVTACTSGNQSNPCV
ncbi:MAG: protein kinase [Ktedonobacteraceae bacterium]|nr:protein kinase [Ktedonobacteraceae bacterium]